MYCTFLAYFCRTNYYSSFQARIKKIMQTDEEIGKVAAAVPVIICILYFRQLSVIIITFYQYSLKNNNKKQNNS